MELPDVRNMYKKPTQLPLTRPKEPHRDTTLIEANAPVKYFVKVYIQNIFTLDSSLSMYSLSINRYNQKEGFSSFSC